MYGCRRPLPAHRLAVSGEPLYYHAYVARKRGDVDAAWIDEAEFATA